MEIKQLKKAWGSPVLMAILIIFGLLAALLGSGYWYLLSWAAMIIPVIIILWKLSAHKVGSKN